jgi:hypothetical protein
MKRKFMFGFLIVLCLSISAFAQSVTITPKKTTYTRPKPVVDFKKTFTVTAPKVKAATPALSRKIETAISFEKNFDLNIQEEKTEIQWLEETGFEVLYNKNGILTIMLSVSGTGAYPSVFEKSVVVDLKTGNRVAPRDVFINLQKLAAKVKTAQKAEVEKTLREIKSDPENKNYEPFDFFDNTNFTVENLSEFAVSDKCVTFIYDYGFPHVILALEPEGKYFFDWAQLKPFIKPGGLLARFIR